MKFVFSTDCLCHKMGNGLDNGQCGCRSVSLEALTVVQGRNHPCVGRASAAVDEKWTTWDVQVCYSNNSVGHLLQFCS